MFAQLFLYKQNDPRQYTDAKVSGNWIYRLIGHRFPSASLHILVKKTPINSRKNTETRSKLYTQTVVKYKTQNKTHAYTNG